MDFILTMERDGPDETIATNGPLEIFARCFTRAGQHGFEIMVTSDVGGWWARDRNTPLGADEEEIILRVDYIPSSSYVGPLYFEGHGRTHTPGALAPDGFYIAAEPDTLSVGLDILGHDCIAIGTVILKQVDLQ
jgi:hypothetical protein